MIKIPKITSTLNPVQMYQKVNDLVDVARTPLKRSTAYTLGEIVHPYGLPSNLYLECTQAGTTSAFTLSLSETVGTILTDGTVKWIVRDLNGINNKVDKFQGVDNEGKFLRVGDDGYVALDDVSGIPVGFERFTTNPNVEAGWKPEFGQEVTRAECADLWAWVLTQDGYLISEAEWQLKFAANDGNVPFYSTGNGTTTFRLPSLKCWVKGANGIEELSNEDKRYLSAGLPNITSNVSFPPRWTGGTRVAGIYYSGGALYNNTAIVERWYADVETSSASGYVYATTGFDASKGEIHNGVYRNDVYGKSDTVQPKSIVGMWQVKAFGTVNTMGTSSVDGIASGLAEVEAKINRKFGENDFTILQVNNGNVVTTNSRYILENPFPNYYVQCKAEINVGGKWGSTGWIYSGGGYGVIADAYDDKIVVQTGDNYLNTYGRHSGNAFGDIITSSALCRIKVWKVGKMQ